MKDRCIALQTVSGVCLKLIRKDGKELSISFTHDTDIHGRPAFDVDEARTYEDATSSKSINIIDICDIEEFADVVHGFVFEPLQKGVK